MSNRTKWCLAMLLIILTMVLSERIAFAQIESGKIGQLRKVADFSHDMVASAETCGGYFLHFPAKENREAVFIFVLHTTEESALSAGAGLPGMEVDIPIVATASQLRLVGDDFARPPLVETVGLPWQEAQFILIQISQDEFDLAPCLKGILVLEPPQ